MATLGTKIARLRSQKGFSQDETAAKLKVSQPAYHKWETDATKPMTMLVKICELFEIDIVELLDDDTSSFAHNTTTTNLNNAVLNGRYSQYKIQPALRNLPTPAPISPFLNTTFPSRPRRFLR